jgi:hypothetical protein
MTGGHDPGACLICGVAHCACRADDQTTVVQLPARDAAAALEVPVVSAPLGDGSDDQPFSTATYRGKKKR